MIVCSTTAIENYDIVNPFPPLVIRYTCESMRLLTAVSLVRAQQGEPKRNTIRMDGVFFLFLVDLQPMQPITTLCSSTERAKSVGEEPKRRRWRMKRGDEVAAVGISAARRRNPGHRKSRLDTRKLPPHKRSFVRRSVVRSAFHFIGLHVRHFHIFEDQPVL